MTKSYLLVGTAIIGVAAVSAAPASAQSFGSFEAMQIDGLELHKSFEAENEDAAAEEESSSPQPEAPVAAEPEAPSPAPAPVVISDVTNGSSDIGTGAFGGLDVSGQVTDSVTNAGLTGTYEGAFRRFDFSGNLVAADPELIVRGDVGIDGAVDRDNTLPAVVQMFLRNNATGGIFFNCTGTLINPRTVLTAAHCVNNRSTRSSEAYGTAATGQFSILIGTGVDTRPQLLNLVRNGANYAQGGLAQSSDVLTHPSANPGQGGLTFPYADVAMIALDEPITDVGTMPILLTPLDQLAHLVVTGYGTNGTGEDGGVNTGSPFLRRVGENMLGAIASQANFIDAVFPGVAPSVDTIGIKSQILYFFDFDKPNRTEAERNACLFTGVNIQCPSNAATRDIDFFDGDALPEEAGTAPGDSGSPLIADQVYDFPIVTGVLSGGYDFFGNNNRYGDVSFYNSLYPFFQFISENTPYKYVTTTGRDGNWSDATLWTQELDPGFFIDDGTGTLVNGLPQGEEPGVLATGPRLGMILGQNVADMPGDVSPNLPPIPPLPESSVLLGPGSTGFVPNNTDGIVGVASANPAQYFDVLLTQQGTITVDMNVEIDRLTIANADARFVLPTGFDFATMIGVEQSNGFATIDGNLNSRLYSLNGGVAQGTGAIATTGGFFNVAGVVAPAGRGATGTLTIDGNYVQTAGGTLAVEIAGAAGSNTGDRLNVTGTAVLGGTLLVTSTVEQVPAFGSTFTVLSAGAIDGTFDQTELFSRSTLLNASSTIDGNNVTVSIGARRITDIVLGGGFRSLGGTLDTMRFGGRYAQFSHLFGVVDAAMPQDFMATLAGFMPTSAFGQTFTANGFAQRFTGQIAQRTLALRGAGNAAAGFSRAGSASFAQAGVAPTANKLGFFGSVSGSYLTRNEDDLSSGATAFEHAAFTEAGELTFGIDYRASSKVAVGVAVSSVRNSASSVIGYHPMNDESMSVAGYAAFDLGKAFADVHFGTATQNYALQRASQGDLTRAFQMARGSAEGQQTFLGMRLGYAMKPVRGVTLGPVASLDYVRSDLGGYSEFDAGSFGLNVDGRTFHSLGAKLGAMAAIDTRIGDTGTASFFGSVAYARELADKTDVVTASFMGAEDLPFQIVNQLDPEWVSVNAGAEFKWSDTFSSKLSVTSDLGRGALTNNQANVAMSWKF